MAAKSSHLQSLVSKIGITILAALLPLFVIALGRIESSTASIENWLPSGGEEQVRYAKFLKQFHTDVFVAVSWEDCRLNDGRLTDFADQLQAKVDSDPQLAIRRIITSAEVVTQMTEGPAKLSRRSTLLRLRGVFVGPDEQALAIIYLKDCTTDEQQHVVQTVIDTAMQATGLERDELRIGGNAYEAVYIDETSARSIKYFVIPSSLAAILVAYLCIRNLQLTLIVLAIASYCQVSGVAFIYFCGGQLNAILSVLPTMLFMLTVSAAIHLINYYQKAGGAQNPRASIEAIKVAWVPCILASTTTAIGFFSLMISDLKPVSDFGFFASLGLLWSTAVLFISFPALVSLLDKSPAIADTDSNPQPTAANTTGERFTQFGRFLSEQIIRHAKPICWAGALVFIVSLLGMSHLRSSVKLESMFEEKSEIIQNYEWIEKHIGPLISVEVLLHFPDDDDTDPIQRAERVWKIHQAILSVEEVGGVYSALSFLPSIPPAGGLRNTMRRTAMRETLESTIPVLVQEGVIARDASGEHWRVTAKVPAVHALDYGDLTDKVSEVVFAMAERTFPKEKKQITITGLSPVLHEAQKLLLSDLTKSFLLALTIITPIMIFALGNIREGLISMVPNVAPAVIVFGALGWLGIDLDIACVLTASVAMGIAVDDTLHFITWFARGQQRGLNLTEAIEFTFARCTKAMLQTTLICASAMLVFAPVEFIPTRKFALLMVAMLVAAIVGDLLLLPALLVSGTKRWRKLPPTEGNS
ncbi:MMPL family protein [Roseimaritima multifibrata]|uniref:MMPL family protein n=1 Tax=Roseimaritima multifibrata TaxID=1930274 RepID=A0A517MLI9_9BACT|nr:MMPL family transporter [Roseimaritima multifibrata]QDS95627.1 MMPL family protein [Roseimaritima multifibrata]